MRGKIPTETNKRDFSEDKFNYEALSKSLLDNIILNMETPNAFGIYGNWGSGKSTILTYMQNHMADNDSLKAVYFEPWQYEYSEQKSLLFAILKKIQKESGHTDKKKAFKKILTNSLVVASGISKSVPSTILGAKLPTFKSVTDDFKLVEKKMYKEHELWIDTIDNFKNDFQVIINQILKNDKKEKLIIFIDDLDRCLPENAIKLIEGIKNLLFVKNVIFVLAIDRRVISEMIEKKYGLHYGYGDEYLMKIIQHYYELNSKNALSPIVEELFTIYGIEYTEKQLRYITKFLQEFTNEPRKAKHYLHQFCINFNISSGAKEFAQANEEDFLFVFVASYLINRYPRYFTPGEPNYNMLEYFRDCAINKVKVNPGNPNAYNEAVKKIDYIDPEDRKRIENTLLHCTTNESKPTTLPITKLGIAIQRIKVM